MQIKRLAAVVGTAAVVFAACSSSASPSPAAGGASGGDHGSRLHRRRVLEQLPAAALGGDRQAEHPEGRRGRRRQVHRQGREPQHRAAADGRRHADLAGCQGPDPARAGHHGRRAGPREGEGRRHPGHRLRPADRGSQRPLHHVRQRRRRQGRGRRDPRQGPEGQLRAHQGRPGRPERQDVPAAGLGRGRPEGQGRLRRHQAAQRPRWHVHGRLEDREGPVEHGSHHRQGRLRQHEDRRRPRRERQHRARRRRGARRASSTGSRRSAARTATRPT